MGVPPDRPCGQRGLLRGDLPALGDDRVQVRIPRRGVVQLLLIRIQLVLHRLAPEQPVLLRLAGIPVPPRLRRNRLLEHIHRPFGVMILNKNL
jgi:hypothetical protein